MANNGVTFALGLAQKAGKLASGDYWRLATEKLATK